MDRILDCDLRSVGDKSSDNSNVHLREGTIMNGLVLATIITITVWAIGMSLLGFL